MSRVEKDVEQTDLGQEAMQHRIPPNSISHSPLTWSPVSHCQLCTEKQMMSESTSSTLGKFLILLKLGFLNKKMTGVMSVQGCWGK